MLNFSNEDLAAKIKEDLGVDAMGWDFLPFPDLEQSVRDDVEKLHNSDLIRRYRCLRRDLRRLHG